MVMVMLVNKYDGINNLVMNEYQGEMGRELS